MCVEPRLRFGGLHARIHAASAEDLYQTHARLSTGSPASFHLLKRTNDILAPEAKVSDQNIVQDGDERR
jgi:hypothetical protein